MKFVMNNDITSFKVRGCDKEFVSGRATILENAEFDALRKNSAMFRDYLDKGKLVVADEMRADWLPLEEQLTEANKMNNKLVSENRQLNDKVASLDKEVKRLMKKLKEQTEALKGN